MRSRLGSLALLSGLGGWVGRWGELDLRARSASRGVCAGGGEEGQ